MAQVAYAVSQHTASVPKEGIVSGVAGRDVSRIIKETRIVPVANVTERAVLFVCPQDYFADFRSIQVFSGEVPSDADGTVLLDIFERDASADTEATIVDDFNLETLTRDEGSKPTLAGVITLPRTLDEHDSIRALVINNTVAIDTAGEVCIRLVIDLRSKF